MLPVAFATLQIRAILRMIDDLDLEVGVAAFSGEMFTERCGLELDLSAVSIVSLLQRLGCLPHVLLLATVARHLKDEKGGEEENVHILQ